MDPDFSQTFLPTFGDFVWAPKGYMVESNMIEWIQNILIPYVVQIRLEINDQNHPVVLMMDNLEQHLTQKVQKELSNIDPVILIPLPPHSSHVAQPCDACVFSSAKSKYNQLKYPDYESKFTSKLVRIQNSIDATLSKNSIIASWEHCGFNITIEEGDASV